MFTQKLIDVYNLKTHHTQAPITNQKYILNSLLLVGLVIINQSIRRTIVTRNLLLPTQLWQNLLRQLLPQLNTPLIKRINIPHGPLREDLHLVHGNQNSEHARSQLLEEEGCGGSVALEDLVGHKGVHLGGGHASFLLELGTDLVGTLPESHGFRLGKVVGKEDGMVVDGCAEVLGDIVVCFDGCEEIAGNDLRSLVDELVEGMLSVRSGLSPDDGPSLDIDPIAFFVDGLSITFHVGLLEVSRESMHVLIVRQDGQTLCLMEVIVPNTDQCQSQWQVVLGIGSQKVLIYGMRSCMHFHPIVKSQRQGDGSTNGRPDGVSTSDPIPKSEHVVGINSKFRDSRCIRGKRGKVLRHTGGISLVVIQKPRLARTRIGHGLLRRKRLGCNQEERPFGIALLENFGSVRPIDIRDEEHFKIAFAVRLERLGDHDRTEVGPSDANVHDRVDGLAGVALPGSIADVFGERLDLGEDGVYLRHDILAVDVDGGVGLVAEGHVEDGAVFGVVDFDARVHFLGLAHDVRFRSELVEEVHGLFRDAVLRVVDEEVLEFEIHFVEAGGVSGEEVADLGVGVCGIVSCEGFPGCGGFDSRHGGYG
mmetsp:Transcript_40401/g.72796  ORF Transcript_40401/g.72796 Transcript_40401/m.72796 type:complete len:592 (+) Transcript_40401:163-1938(+)